ncbi:DUF3025 domain-containing protein [Rhodoferax sp.]|uniref:DUF3025 domain-containing protein n=1 Tax=Rhodoferax sp. TaxID=50421 RepID=UPI0026235762|nr:DUF3025 domain-containing protein [Rhodoferax sp.]MDD2811637.1 DUF3025 domain-containing protein [Rhodoferax sp.]MDD4942079.1 DUF3025 domain-containing protein [Rhodoferax sp.]MDD5480106.1 DUF3025 domain-containing protein [Rhodoferax sp.]
MTSDALTKIDWQAPWLQPWQALGQATAAQVLTGTPQPEALNTMAQRLWPDPCTRPMHFVPQTALPAGMAYERCIFEQHACPTREGRHDFFNGLAWLLFPHTKRRLNQLHMTQLQAADVAHSGVATVRGATRDALTVFDENAAVLCAPDALWQALAAKDWQAVFGTLAPLWHQSRLVLFGHALLEKLVYPRKPITAHVIPAPLAIQSIVDLDTWLAHYLSADQLAGKPFAHLPVLGVPGWWPANTQPDFYADRSVFRPPRQPAPRLEAKRL